MKRTNKTIPNSKRLKNFPCGLLNISVFLVFISAMLCGCAKAGSNVTKVKPLPVKVNYGEHVLYGYPCTSCVILNRKGYTLCYNNNRKVADWASYHLVDTYLADNVPRTDDFRADPDLPRGKRSELSDYKGSGYDRGHLVPAEDMRRDLQTESETFLLSNMSPQVGVGFNQGIWKELEAKVRNWAEQRKNIYVITGPIYDGKNIKTIGKDNVSVPTSFYKIIVSCDSAGSNLDTIAFILPNAKNPAKLMPVFITSIDEVEKRTGLDFLRDLDGRIENKLEVKKAQMWKN